MGGRVAAATAASTVMAALTAVAVVGVVQDHTGAAPRAQAQAVSRPAVTLRAKDAVDAVRGRDYRPLRSLPVQLSRSGVYPEALTPDGLLLRSIPRGGTYDLHVDYELFDPRTGRRTRLPSTDLQTPVVIEAGTRMLRVAVTTPRPAVVSFDRRTRAWSRLTLPRLPASKGSRTSPYTVAMPGDGRVYVETLHPRDEGGQLWSFPARNPRAVRLEAAITSGFSAVGDLLAYADPSRVDGPAVLHLRRLSTGQERTVRLPRCNAAGVQGNAETVAVRVSCPGLDYHTRVFGADGRLVATLLLPADSFVTGVTHRFVLLVGPFAFDLVHRRLLRLSHYGFDVDGWPQGNPAGTIVGIPDGRGDRHSRVRLVTMTGS